MTKEELYKKKLEPYFQGEDRVVLDQLLEHAAYLYKSLYRYSGESYFLRALRLTCDKILKLKPDRATIMATVLISACYSPRCDLDKIEHLFGLEVRKLVESLGKINAIKSRYSSSDTRVLSKMFLSLAIDLRVIIIRLADRIENMETLQFKSLEKQKANAREILDVYVPIASRLGLYEFKLTLEDLAFKYVFPDEYKALKKELDEYLSFSKKTIDEIKKELKSVLFRNGFRVDVSGRIKNLFSIYKKMKKKTATLPEIYDIYAMRVVLKSDPDQVDGQENIEKLYKILSLLHSEYKNLPERFKDYVMNPKSNGYKSLHTALLGLNTQNTDKPTEIQIRTAAMHKFSEHGFAAHWLYKEGSQVSQDEAFLKALQDLRKNSGRVDSSTAVLKMNLYKDRVFVLSPDNLVKELPVGATPIDFAFAIHSEIGHHCNLAKVNGAVVPLDYQLRNGDIIEIITTNKINTKLSWLEFVRTKQARNRIKNYFRTLDKDSLLDQGREELNLLLEKLKFEELDENLNFLKTYKGKALSLKEREELLEELGAGTVTAGTVFKNAYGKSADALLNEKIKEPVRKKGILPKHNKSVKYANQNAVLLIGGEKGVPYRIATCCKPKITDQIIAYVTKNRGVSLHKLKCGFVSTAKADRLLVAGLTSDLKQNDFSNKYQVSLQLEMETGGNALFEVVQFCERNKITILGFSTLKKTDNLASRQIIVDILDGDDLQAILANLEHLSGVVKVAKV
ncbi:bifunctional (p)ppGpp synthetase/guanosine-3',5'-bis(diphosphate) 3'-pyrophosphohydrolase [Candidatus Peregrinibacteria bacterium]|nr:bifunctional (p)ppGpp synthetase/guanosine-3',5'-bis(diphosphate) 3'-pyrophosphohydrolase [Candidatus Peregrinibacteria bacterium]